MTYCLGIVTRSGLVMGADSRTNAGVDYISTYRKLFDLSVPGQRVILICTSGNLSITQAVIHALHQDLKIGENENVHSLLTMYEIACYIGKKIREIQETERPWLERDRIDYTCTLLLGGQIQGEQTELYMIYSQGNCIQAARETPFLQIGETKYGKPIMDRILTYETSVEDAAKCALLSIDSTMKSNISVGPPINLVMYRADSLVVKHQLTLQPGDRYLEDIRKQWEHSIRTAFEQTPDVLWY
ncbi:MULTISPECIES: proteasome-type protease [unclassified Leptolyngbya]|uniref:proteasome-type protease n=1 Tax=unclassified Leptolyngbya TaxID=2650499 RepID=UPI00168747B9|nr:MULTISPECIES: proteasome-type protease [unclassified Leptolyngbya]MBD1910674.1 proteasome-type protease [Leptolyngbya sp. FACHB-8]MBD2154271.1 proteasome-type protease [Leptolyngbya sp. FACHB-16]